jgi:osmotically-inducible protein OsmY
MNPWKSKGERKYAMSVIDRETAAIGTGSHLCTTRHWEVSETAEDRLQHCPYLELRNVFCSFHEGVLTLRGRVSSFYMKQLAQTLVGGLAGVMELNNQLEVISQREGDR